MTDIPEDLEFASYHRKMGISWSQPGLSWSQKVGHFYKIRDEVFLEKGWLLNEDHEVALRESMVVEEGEEFKEAIKNYKAVPSIIQKRRAAKDLSNFIYSLIGYGLALGLDMDRIFTDIHWSNLSKLTDPKISPDGKILEPENYYEPKLEYVKDDKSTTSR